jgi:hypothetical protein
MVSAAIKFEQGALIGVAGQALEGIARTSVTVSNGDDTGVVTWEYKLESAPIGSSLIPGILGTSSSVSFLPDVEGGYGISLKVVGPSGTATDRRVFSVPTAWGHNIPASGFDGNAHNFGGQSRGWAGTSTTGQKLLDSFIAFVSTALRTFAGDVGGLFNNNMLVKIQGNTILASTPVANDALVYDGTKWAPSPRADKLHMWRGIPADEDQSTGATPIVDLGHLTDVPDIGTDPVMMASTTGQSVRVTRLASMAVATGEHDFVLIKNGMNDHYELWWNGNRSGSAGASGYGDLAAGETKILLYWIER